LFTAGDVRGHEMIERSFRYGQLQNIMKMGPIGKVMQMIPGLGNMMPQVKQKMAAARRRRLTTKNTPRKCFP
jgi:signal recognition particle GTPase